MLFCEIAQLWSVLMLPSSGREKHSQYLNFNPKCRWSFASCLSGPRVHSVSHSNDHFPAQVVSLSSLVSLRSSGALTFTAEPQTHKTFLDTDRITNQITTEQMRCCQDYFTPYKNTDISFRKEPLYLSIRLLFHLEIVEDHNPNSRCKY